MPLVNLKPVLAQAKANEYAVAAFNPVDYLSMRAMVAAAEAESSASIQVDDYFVDYPIAEKAQRTLALIAAIEAKGK